MIKIEGSSIPKNITDIYAIHTNVANEISTIPIKLYISPDDLFVIESTSDGGEKRAVHLSSIVDMEVFLKGPIDPRKRIKNTFSDWNIQSFVKIQDQLATQKIEDGLVTDNGTICYTFLQQSGNVIYSNGIIDTEWNTYNLHSSLGTDEYIKKIAFGLEPDSSAVLLSSFNKNQSSPIGNFKIYYIKDNNFLLFDLRTPVKPSSQNEEIINIEYVNDFIWIVTTHDYVTGYGYVYTLLTTGFGLTLRHSKENSYFHSILKLSFNDYIIFSNNLYLTSSDGGLTWFENPISYLIEKAVLVEPSRTSDQPVILALSNSTYNYILISYNGGETFTPVLTRDDVIFTDIIYFGYNFVIAEASFKNSSDYGPYVYFYSYDNGSSFKEFIYETASTNRKEIMKTLYNYFNNSIYFATNEYDAFNTINKVSLYKRTYGEKMF